MLIQKINYTPQHIVSIGNICNNNCIYCLNKLKKNKMTKRKAKEIIKFISSIPTDYLYLEITGGEPLLNREVLYYLIEEFNKLKIFKKHISIVSNLHLINDTDIKTLIKNKISICTSLDGPKEIHNYLRDPDNKKSYDKVIKSLKKIIYLSKKKLIEKPNLITTITKISLPFYKEIINEYLKLGINRIQLGLVEEIGIAKINWKKIGINIDEYLKFYEKCLDEIFRINNDKKIPLYEKGFFLILKSIKENKPHIKRSIPILNRLSYNYNGNIYPDDETKSLHDNKLLNFSLGNVKKIKSFQNFIKKEKIKEIIYILSKTYDSNCTKCEYYNICNIPIWTLKTNNIKPSYTEKCLFFKGIMNIVKYTLKNNKTKEIINSWLNIYE